LARISSLWSISSLVLNPLPSAGSICASDCFTVSATWTVLDPGCLTTSRMMASRPFRRAMVRRSATPSVTFATSSSRTCEPVPLVAMGRSRS